VAIVAIPVTIFMPFVLVLGPPGTNTIVCSRWAASSIRLWAVFTVLVEGSIQFLLCLSDPVLALGPVIIAKGPAM